MVLFKLTQFLSLVLSCILLAVVLAGSHFARRKDVLSSYLTDTGQVVSRIHLPFNYVLNTSTTDVFDNKFQRNHVFADIGTLISSYDDTSAEYYDILIYDEAKCLARPPSVSYYFKNKSNALIDTSRRQACSLLDYLIIHGKKMKKIYPQYKTIAPAVSITPSITQHTFITSSIVHHNFITTLSHATTYKTTMMSTVTLTPSKTALISTVTIALSTVTKTVSIDVPKRNNRNGPKCNYRNVPDKPLNVTRNTLPIATKT